MGHLVSPMAAAGYNESFKKWHYDDLLIMLEYLHYVLASGKEDAFENLRSLMERPDVDTIVNACDAGREGELIFRLVYEMAGCKKPIMRLWVSSMEGMAIREGLDDLRPGAKYETLYQSALCRQKADWPVGINVTRLFSVLYHRTLNVGRVQTPTLAMLVDRDWKISHFKKEKYHHVRLRVDGAEAVSEKIAAQEVHEACAGDHGHFRLRRPHIHGERPARYGLHHSTEDGKYFIMGNGTQAFAVTVDPVQEKDNPLRTAEMTIEDDYGMIDGIINNGRRDETLAKPSIREPLEDAKRECAEHKPPEKGRPDRDTPEHGDL